jgi:prevent-host-death family protein
MITYSLKQARANLGRLLRRAEAGQTITITRRGRNVAQVKPSSVVRSPLPSLVRFRKSIRVKGQPLSATVSELRDQERYNAVF